MDMTALSPAQAQGADWLSERGNAYLADPPGFGKTRQLLAACADARHVTVVCPAAIRDAKVWPGEAARVGFDLPLTVMSYHELAKRPVEPGGALIFDEAHRLKSRKVSWGANAMGGSAASSHVLLASGTPTPNGYLPELYGQMRLIADYPASYWKWVQQWFDVTTSRYSEWYVPGTLVGCSCEVADPSDPDACPHRAAFWNSEVGDLMLRRPESSLDLPDMIGFDDPLDTPMTKEQRRVYTQLKRDLIADLPDGTTIEKLTSSGGFVALMQAATGLCSLDPDTDVVESGKLKLLEELLPDRSHPTLVGVYYRNTAVAVAKLCERLGLRYAEFGGATPPAAREAAVSDFQAGRLDVLIGSVSVVSEGITLTAADQVVMLERAWVPGVNEQTVRRVRRRGQDKTVVVRQPVTPKSVDAGQWAVLRAKTRNINAVLTRAEVLELLG